MHREMLFVVNLILRRFPKLRFGQVLAGARERFSRQELNAGLLYGPRRQRCRETQWLMPLAVVVVFEVFEYVAHV